MSIMTIGSNLIGYPGSLGISGEPGRELSRTHDGLRRSTPASSSTVMAPCSANFKNNSLTGAYQIMFSKLFNS
jgi:hypothetical protein